jgi:hypothetical protein
MLKNIIFLLLLIATLAANSQVLSRDINSSGFDDDPNKKFQDSLNNKFVSVKLSGKTHYTDYKIISFAYDTTYVDTTLTIYKDYKFNYIRKDNFELLPFHNQGQTFNQLGYDFSEVSLFPQLGARAKHYNYYAVDDVNYYHVPTPTTELFYRTGLEQGQVLDAIFTFNTSKRHNASIAYKGLRSLGKYRNSLSSHGNMRITYSYATENDRYTMRSHIVAQDLTNNENGGLTDESVAYFENDDPNFTDRGRMEINFSEASNELRGNRYYLEHDFKIWQRKDTVRHTKNYLKVGHTFNYEIKHYNFKQSPANTTILGDAFNTTINDKRMYVILNNEAHVALKSPIVLGEVKFKASHLNYNYKYTTATHINDTFIPPSIDGNSISVGGEWKTKLKKFNIEADAATILTGDLTGNYFKGSAIYEQDSLFTFKGTFLLNSKSPNFNFMMNQSDYIHYNWLNNLKNERTRSLLFDLTSEKILNASVQLTQIDNYTHFDENIRVSQTDNTVNYLKVKVSKELKVGKFALNNTLMYQKVAQGSSAFRVPEFVTRNSFYFTDYLFKGDPLYLQTGFTFKYFTKYYANSYDPVLSEFYIQNAQKIGGYPVVDFFINGQVQRTRLYLKAEHLNSLFGKPNYYAAPLYPYRDFIVRFGIVWNFFI